MPRRGSDSTSPSPLSPADTQIPTALAFDVIAIALTAVANEALAAVGTRQPDRICIFIPLAKGLGRHIAVVNIRPRPHHDGPALGNHAAGCFAAHPQAIGASLGQGARQSQGQDEGCQKHAGKKARFRAHRDLHELSHLEQTAQAARGMR